MIFLTQNEAIGAHHATTNTSHSISYALFETTASVSGSFFSSEALNVYAKHAQLLKQPRAKLAWAESWAESGVTGSGAESGAEAVVSKSALVACGCADGLVLGIFEFLEFVSFPQWATLELVWYPFRRMVIIVSILLLHTVYTTEKVDSLYWTNYIQIMPWQYWLKM